MGQISVQFYTRVIPPSISGARRDYANKARPVVSDVFRGILQSRNWYIGVKRREMSGANIRNQFVAVCDPSALPNKLGNAL